MCHDHTGDVPRRCCASHLPAPCSWHPSPKRRLFLFSKSVPLLPSSPLFFLLFLPCSTSPCQAAVVACLLSQGQRCFASSRPFSAQIPPELSWLPALGMLQAARFPAACPPQLWWLCSPGGFSFFWLLCVPLVCRGRVCVCLRARLGTVMKLPAFFGRGIVLYLVVPLPHWTMLCQVSQLQSLLHFAVFVPLPSCSPNPFGHPGIATMRRCPKPQFAIPQICCL